MVYNHGTRFSTKELNLFKPREENPKKGTPAPAVFTAHLDQSSWSGSNVLHKWIPEDAEDLFHGRVVIVNVGFMSFLRNVKLYTNCYKQAWRPIKTVYKNPFGVTDAASVPHTDLCPRPYSSFQDVRETVAIKPNPNHRWCYKFAQTADEVLIFKGYDNHGTSRVCPHSAFKDEEFEDGEPRESIEIRALLLWPDHASVQKGAALPS
jgi:hypothetical protein